MTVTFRKHARPLPEGALIPSYVITVVVSCLGTEPQKLVVDATVTPPSVTLWNVHVFDTQDYLDVNDDLTESDRRVIRKAVVNEYLRLGREDVRARARGEKRERPAMGFELDRRAAEREAKAKEASGG